MSIEAKEHAALFWDFYERGLFIRLERQDNGTYQGEALDYGEDGERMFPNQIAVSISREDLLKHVYREDRRFQKDYAETLTAALATLLEQEALAEEGILNRARLNLLLQLLREPAPQAPSPSEPPPDVVSAVRTVVCAYATGELERGQFIAELTDLVEEQGQDFAVFANAVLDGLEEETFSVTGAIQLLSRNEAPDIPYPVLHGWLRHALATCSVPTERACRFLERLLPTTADYQEMQSSGRLAAVKIERDILVQAIACCPADPEAATQLVKILNNHKNEDLFFVLDTVKALGLHNSKAAIAPMIQCLDQRELEKYWGDIEEALQMLCSGSELIPQAIFGIDFENMSEAERAGLEAKDEEQLRIEYDYWHDVSSSLPGTDDAWMVHDAGSVFWEKRLRCARQLKQAGKPQVLLSRLQEDEVETVRNAVN